MSQIEIRPNGDAVLKGTTIEVYRIAALIGGGMSRQEILGDYPSLTADQVEFAAAYAQAHPNLGRPYPPLTAKAALRQADLSGLDLDD